MKRRYLVGLGFCLALILLIISFFGCIRMKEPELFTLPKHLPITPREERIQSLASQEFDLVIIGGGATGAGIALDAASRGLEVVLIEGDDFAAGSSSRSTKLVHGGVRYLEQAILGMDRSQLHLVSEALHERAIFLRIAPHLAHVLPILTPVYGKWESFYYYAGLKLYDWVSRSDSLHGSTFISAEEALEIFPHLRKEGLGGAVFYYDGQFNDARMNVSVALSAASQGAVLVNHAEVTELIHEEGLVRGVRVHDQLENRSFDVRGRVVVNATGPLTDRIRRMDDPEAEDIILASSGTHVLLDKSFSPEKSAILIPKTDDGRVLFLMPWEGATLAGTTDHPAEVTREPRPNEEEVRFILEHLGRYFDVELSTDDVLACWTGLRPLVKEPGVEDTAKISREHVIEVSPNQLLTVAGGKWTIFRRMAEDAVDKALELGGLQSTGPSTTASTYLLGAENFHENLASDLRREFDVEEDVAVHLAYTYGDQAEKVAKIAQAGYSRRLASEFPYLEAEVIHGIRAEMACTVVDILARRTRLAFLSQKAAKAAMPRVLELMVEELNWTVERQQRETEQVERYLDTMTI